MAGGAAIDRLEEEEAALSAVLRDASIEELEPDEIAALAEIDRDAPDVSHEDVKHELGL